jgi:hypothetical protein
MPVDSDVNWAARPGGGTGPDCEQGQQPLHEGADRDRVQQGSDAEHAAEQPPQHDDTSLK